uniref:Predicted protein n=1 Tax=Hordeum vulgare subsp. vulgare TaxID=112509 RepID=F2DNJ4_HORVV|nr:predicted protein [Hordeum vulgare subsp. vulgare]
MSGAIVSAYQQQMLTGGEVFLKYGRSGAPKQRAIWCSKGLDKIFWGEPKHLGKDSKASGFLKTSELMQIVIGTETPVFRKQKKVGEPYNCFSLVALDRSLDLEIINHDDRDIWINAFSAIKPASAKDNVMVRSPTAVSSAPPSRAPSMPDYVPEHQDDDYEDDKQSRHSGASGAQPGDDAEPGDGDKQFDDVSKEYQNNDHWGQLSAEAARKVEEARLRAEEEERQRKLAEEQENQRRLEEEKERERKKREAEEAAEREREDVRRKSLIQQALAKAEADKKKREQDEERRKQMEQLAHEAERMAKEAQEAARLLEQKEIEAKAAKAKEEELRRKRQADKEEAERAKERDRLALLQKREEKERERERAAAAAASAAANGNKETPNGNSSPSNKEPVTSDWNHNPVKAAPEPAEPGSDAPPPAAASDSNTTAVTISVPLSTGDTPANPPKEQDADALSKLKIPVSTNGTTSTTQETAPLIPIQPNNPQDNQENRGKCRNCAQQCAIM